MFRKLLESIIKFWIFEQKISYAVSGSMKINITVVFG